VKNTITNRTFFHRPKFLPWLGIDEVTGTVHVSNNSSGRVRLSEPLPWHGVNLVSWVQWSRE